MVCISSVYPLDLARGRITTSPGVYKGLGDALVRISKEEGVGALYKGISHANIWAIPYYAATFCSYDAAKKFYIEGYLGEGEEKRTVGPGVGLLLGMVGGCCGTVAGFPFEVRMAQSGARTRFLTRYMRFKTSLRIHYPTNSIKSMVIAERQEENAASGCWGEAGDV
jgi:hypothetical protein